MLRIGLIGCGHIGTVHSFALKQLHDGGLIDARVAATFDAEPERAARLAAHHDAAAAPSLDALLDAVDVAWVCTWTAGHREAVEAAVARGLPVFCEKPLAPSLDECRRLATALERVPHQVGLVLRHAPVFANAAELVASGRYGRPLDAILRNDQYFPIQGAYASTWRSDPALAGGGTLIEHSIHDVDVLTWLFGRPSGVQASVSSHFGYDGIEDSATVLLDFEAGVTATLVSVWHQVLSRPSTRRLEVFFEDAFVWTEDDYLGPLHVETTDGDSLIEGHAPDWTDRLAVPEVYAKSLAQYCEPSKEFLDALVAHGPAARGFPDVATALAAHEVVDAAYRSAEGRVR